jgi:hypothetical protein
MRTAEQVRMQALILQQQLRQMAERGNKHSPSFYEGLGKLKAAAWVLEMSNAEETLVMDNKAQLLNEAIWG